MAVDNPREGARLGRAPWDDDTTARVVEKGRTHVWNPDGQPTATGSYWKCAACGGVTWRSTRRAWLAYDGTFEMDFLLDGETVHAPGDGSTDAVIETADGPVRARVGQTFVRTPDGRVEVSG